jgi:hypothetical protein
MQMTNFYALLYFTERYCCPSSTLWKVHNSKKINFCALCTKIYPDVSVYSLYISESNKFVAIFCQKHPLQDSMDYYYFLPFCFLLDILYISFVLPTLPKKLPNYVKWPKLLICHLLSYPLNLVVFYSLTTLP